MPDDNTLHIHRPHTLGLPAARQAAHQWAEKAQSKFDMQCTYAEGTADAGDTLHFSRPGMEGTLQVTGERFELQAELGFLFAAFKQRIAAEIEEQFDKLLGAQPAQRTA
ncbi:polyhydroxyalkanoic acid system family protein [Paracidovorax wautersii]|uniref:Putative polyhydroxyalkanoic acid system protein n=1 Tax=Paracidovorax wautersii TaxID=1177982 RepID=A0A1I2GXN1_9BURK|nr:polyhydroxyalkanoic acid system family protein [Paracidovorax wautersii]SFF21900.1 putative polyhydroxyalkanoic acid system protein [Paracidovorax wautersii]